MAKKDASDNAEGTEDQSVDQRQERKNYFAIKKRALAYEKDNYTEILVIRTPDKIKKREGYWWKMFGHSAVFYKYWVGERLKHKVRLLPDTDYEARSKEGCVSINDVNRLKQTLRTLKVYPSKETEKAIIFKLGERVTEQDYALMLHEDEMRLEMTNKLIQPKEHMTELNAKLKDALQLVHECVRKMDGASRETFGAEMERRTVELQILVLRAARGTIDVDYCLERAYDIAEDLYGFVLVLLNLRMLETKRLYVLAEAVVALEKQVKKEKKKRALKEIDDSIERAVKAKTARKTTRKSAKKATKKADEEEADEGAAGGVGGSAEEAVEETAEEAATE